MFKDKPDRYNEDYIQLLERAKKEYEEYLRITDSLKVLDIEEEVSVPYPTPRHPMTAGSN